MESRIIRNELKPKNIFNENSTHNLNERNTENPAENLNNPNNLNVNLDKGKEKIIKHANFYHNFSEYNVNITDIIPLFFKKESYSIKNNLDNNK